MAKKRFPDKMQYTKNNFKLKNIRITGIIQQLTIKCNKKSVFPPPKINAENDLSYTYAKRRMWHKINF